MANHFKDKETESTVAQTVSLKSPSKKNGVGKLLRYLNVPSMFRSEVLLPTIPYLLFLVALAISYIGYSYRSEKRIRAIDKVGKEIKQLRTEYITGKSELMQASRASAVALKVQPLGLKQAVTPPGKIVNDITGTKN